MEWLWKKPWLILVGATVLVQVFGSSSGCFQEEKQSLLDFKAAYSNESLLPSWVANPKSNCCDWERVTCDSSTGHVTSLSLEALNRKRGKYGNCLQSVRLNWSLFLPLTELSSLDLSHNCFEGIVWKEGLCQMKQLTELHLSDNDFRGTLNMCLTNLTSIETLDLSHNFFSGHIPVSINEMSSLKKLNLGHNSLSGNVPENILDGCTSLSELMLDNNQLDGTLLSWIGKKIWTSRTKCATGPAFQGPYIIDLSHNKFSGILPSSFGMPLIFINLKGNSLTGMIPESIFDSPYLMGIDLSYNNFMGTVPKTIYGLETLVFLLLAGNKLQGLISNQICRLQRLQILDLSHNNFTGSIPSCFNNMAFRDGGLNFSSVYSPHPYMEHIVFDEGYNREVQIITKGLSSSYQGKMLKIMTALDLSSNQLTGEIPQQIGDLSGLHALNLSHNHLNGSIPKNFHKLEKIESLDLSYNDLSGQIPLDLQDLYTLSIFNVSYNNLSGRAPEKGQFGTFDESSYRGNPYLSWSISNRGNATPPSPPAPLGQGKKDDSTIDFTSFLWSFVVSYVMAVLVLVIILWMNPYWRRIWFYYVQSCLLKCFGEFLEDKFY